MPKKAAGSTITNSAPKAAPKSKTVASTDPLPDGAAEVAKTTKPRATSVPPKAKAGLASPTSSDSVAPMTNGVAAQITDDHVREQAYHLWLNGEPGDAEHHWHLASRKLRGQ